MDLEEGKHNEIIQNDIKYLSYCSIGWMLIISIPMLVCDLYFGLSNDSCLHEELISNFNLKTYLIVHGFVELLSLLINILSVYVSFILCSNKRRLIEHKFINFDDSDIEECIIINKIIQFIFSLFNIIWTILGSILFWNHIYPNDMCNDQLKNYLLISLIIKSVLYSICIVY